jgi:hypothetical protein
MNTVTVVAHPTTGAIITPSSNNPEWGTVRVDAQSVEFNNGIMNTRSRTAFIRGEIKNLKQMFTRAGQILQGKIIRETSFSPFYAGQSPVANPQTGETILKNGQEFYQNYVFTTNLSDSDRDVNPQEISVPAGNVGVAETV